MIVIQSLKSPRKWVINKSERGPKQPFFALKTNEMRLPAVITYHCL